MHADFRVGVRTFPHRGFDKSSTLFFQGLKARRRHFEVEFTNGRIAEEFLAALLILAIFHRTGCLLEGKAQPHKQQWHKTAEHDLRIVQKCNPSSQKTITTFSRLIHTPARILLRFSSLRFWPQSRFFLYESIHYWRPCASLCLFCAERPGTIQGAAKLFSKKLSCSPAGRRGLSCRDQLAGETAAAQV